MLRSGVSSADGREIDARADEFFAVFERAADAVQAAAAIQRAFGRKRWPDDLPVRVRIGIHSGRPTLTDIGYIGLAVHIVARVCSVAHGGQIVISEMAKDAVAESSSTGVRYRNLGRHRLPGLMEPQGLFQIEADGLPATFPPPRTEARS
jgi:class 3 adenylate cyclase